jgi:3-oxoacyl-[acyl-carrier-protein] synthase II
MNGSVFITGLGLITPLGPTVEQTWRALLEGQFIRDHARVPGLHDDDTGFQRAGAARAVELSSIHEHLARVESPCHGEGRSRVVRLALSASREAISHAQWSDDELGDPQTALIVGTSKGPIESWLTAPPGQPIGRCVSESDCCFGLADLAARLAREIGFGPGPRATLSGACASGIHALIHGVMLLRSGVARRALVVAAEASVHPLFVGSFRRLGVLPREGAGCCPFDKSRDGFLISEAGAALCLETSEPDAAADCVRIDGFALGADATHLTGSDPDGRALKSILSRVIDSRPVDLIHAHATGTVLSDPIELSAIESVAADIDPPPSVWSHKGALGHSLGAAGLVSVVLNCISHATGIVPPNVRTISPLPTRRVSISSQQVGRRIRRSLAIASGFGGAMGAVSLVS